MLARSSLCLNAYVCVCVCVEYCCCCQFFICVYRDHFFGRFRPVNMPIYVYIIFITEATKANPLAKFVIFNVSACQPFSILHGLFFAPALSLPLPLIA